MGDRKCTNCTATAAKQSPPEKPANPRPFRRAEFPMEKAHLNSANEVTAAPKYPVLFSYFGHCPTSANSSSALPILGEGKKMEQIQHLYLDIGGLTLHVAELGKGEKGVVVFLHGFPEIWYSWRHQMVAVAGAGFRAIAPDWRGYGLSQQPAEPEKNASWSDLISDLLGILDHFAVAKAFLVGKDFGAVPAYYFALLHPDRVSGVITLGIPFLAQNLALDMLPKGFYMNRWREPGRAEADFGRFDAKTVVRNIYILFSGSELPVAGEDQEIMDLVDPSVPLPHWFSEEDLNNYASLYEKSGFTFALQIPYRKLQETEEVADPKVQVPCLLVMGEKDYVIKFPEMESYIRSGMVKNFVPDLEIKFLPEGTHFVQEQSPEEVNQLIISFLIDHTPQE